MSDITGVKGPPLSGLRKFLTTESPLKIMKIAFYFMLKALFVLKIFTFLPTFWSCREWLDKKAIKKAKDNFKIYYITDWTANNYNIYIAQYLEK